MTLGSGMRVGSQDIEEHLVVWRPATDDKSELSLSA